MKKLIIAAALAAIATHSANAERYMHHCSTDVNNPTLVGPHAITRGIASIEFRKFYPGTNPKTKVITTSKGKLVDARAMIKGTLKICYFRNTTWKVNFFKYPK